MSIVKVVQVPSGASGEFSKVAKGEIFADSETVVITTNIFASEEARDAGNNILWVERTVIPFAYFTQDPRNLLYTFLNNYSFSPFNGGTQDEGTPSTDNTFQLTEEAQADVDYGSVIPVYQPGGEPPANTFAVWDKTQMIADGVDAATIGNLPPSVTVTFLKVPAGVARPQPVLETSGSFGFQTTVPGNYTIQLEAVSYLTSITTIQAIAGGQ